MKYPGTDRRASSTADTVPIPPSGRSVNIIHLSASDEQKIEPLFLTLTGIGNTFEAGHLIRLFHDVEPTVQMARGEDDPVSRLGESPAEPNDSLSCGSAGDSLISPTQGASPGIHVHLDAATAEGVFTATVSITRHGREIGHRVLSFHIAGAPSASDMFLQSRKLCVRTALYQALSEAFGIVLPWGSLTGVRPVKLAACCLDAEMPQDEIHRLLQERTGMQANKAALILAVANRERPFLKPPDQSVSIYVGIPFCSTRCLYCSFTSYPEKKYGHLIPAYLEALAKEVRFVGKWLADSGRTVSSLYIGGGTPTSLSAEKLNALLSMLANELPVHTVLEYTVEAGRPDSVDQEKLNLIKAAGASRISINPQTMRKETLQLIGRDHTPEHVENAFAMAREIGFDNINADLIAGLPGETPDHFRTTLARMAPLMPDSLTVHTMAVKRASRLHESIVDGSAEPPTPDASVQEMIADAADFAENQGLHPYYLYRQKNILANLENTGYARLGCECRYNVETMSERQTIIAVGSGGITKVSHDGRRLERAFNVRELCHYIGRIDEMVDRKRELLERHMPG